MKIFDLNKSHFSNKMVNLDDPSFYVSIFSSACLMISEILPFINIVKANGFFEMIINALNDHKNSKVQNVEDIELNVNSKNQEKILELVKKQDESIKELNNKFDTLIIVLKK